MQVKSCRARQIESNMTTQSITEKLYEQADEELKKRCAEAGKDLYDLVCDGSCHKIDIGAGPHDYWSLLDAVRNLAFDLRRDENRQNKVNEFMSNVNRLGSEIDQIRNSLPQ